MIRFLTVLLSGLLVLLEDTLAKRLIRENLAKYIVQQNFSLQMDLLDYFFGDDLRFNATSVNGTNLQVSGQILSSASYPINTFDLNTQIIGLKCFNSSMLVLTNGVNNDTTNFYLHMFNFIESFDSKLKQRNLSLNYSYKTYPISTTNATTNETRVTMIYSLESVLNSGDYYLDSQVNSTYPNGTKVVYDIIMQGNIANFTSGEANYSRTVTNPKLVGPQSRRISISMISLMFNNIFRQTTLPDAVLTTLIEVLPIASLGNYSVGFQLVYTFNNSVNNLKGLLIYQQDLWIGCYTQIMRIQLNTTTFKVLKVKNATVDNLTTFDIQISDGHIDVHYTTSDSTATTELKRLRWDTFDSPFSMESLTYPSDLTSVWISNRIILAFSLNRRTIYARRANDQFIYISLPCISFNVATYSMSPDGITIAVIEASPGGGPSLVNVYKLRSSAYLTVTNPQNDLVTIDAYYQTIKNSSSTFTLQIWNDSSIAIMNIENPANETNYLNETLSSELLLSKLVPSAWFMGNFLNFSLVCSNLPSSAVNFYQNRMLGKKRMSFSTGGLNSRNIFYYEIASEAVDGTYLLVFQLQLNIYFQKCLISQNNELRCQTVKKISNETDMIIEGSIIKSRYFMYLTSKGYIIHDIQDQQTNPKVIMNSQGTCKYLNFLNYDTIACSNYQTKSLEVRYLSPDGKILNLFTKSNTYSTQIDYYNNTQFIFLMNEYSIDVISLRTAVVVSSIVSNVTQRSDKIFKLCGKYLIVSSVVMNAFEQYDISDVFNIILIQGTTYLAPLGLKLMGSVITKFERSCSVAWPLLVTDGTSVFSIFINIGAPSSDLLDSKIMVGDFHYLSNYFVSALNVLSSSTRPRIVWSFLDTSNTQDTSFFGFEVEVFKDYLMEIDLSAVLNTDSKTQLLSCNLGVTSNVPNSNKFSIPFRLQLNLFTTNLKVKLDGSTFSNQTFQLDMFNPISRLNVTQVFAGQPLAYTYFANDEDYNRSIVYKEKLTIDDQFSKLVKSSRDSTNVMDFYVSAHTSFHILTSEGVYKIKNATNYFVQNYMMFTNTASDGGKMNCRRLILNEVNNIMVNLCDQANIPFFILSNWNSLKPGVIFQKQISSFKDISSIRYLFSSDNILYLFSYSIVKNLQLKTTYLKYRVGLDSSQNIDIQFLIGTDINTSFLFISQFLLKRNTLGPDGRTTDSYFVGLSGSNKFAEDTYMTVLKDYDENNVIMFIGNWSIATILGSQYTGFYSSAVSLECNFLSAGNYISCAIAQERNIHFMVNIYLTTDKIGTVTATFGLKCVAMNYGNQIPVGAIDFDENYLAIVTSRPGGTNTTYPMITNLTKYYILVYDIANANVQQTSDPFSNLVTISSGMPLPSVKLDPSSIKLKILTINNSTYLFLVSKSYYSYQTYRFGKDFLIEVNKNIQSNYLTVRSVNHYSTAAVGFKIYDKFVRIIIISAIIIGATIIIVFIITFIIGRKNRTKGTTFAGVEMAIDEDEASMSEEKKMEKNKSITKKRFSLADDLNQFSTIAKVRGEHQGEAGKDKNMEQIAEEGKEEDLLSSDEEDTKKDQKKTDSLPNRRTGQSLKPATAGGDQFESMPERIRAESTMIDRNDEALKSEEAKKPDEVKKPE